MALKEAQQLPDPVVVAQAPECQQVYEEMLCREARLEVAREPVCSARPPWLKNQSEGSSIPAFC